MGILFIERTLMQQTHDDAREMRVYEAGFEIQGLETS